MNAKKINKEQQQLWDEPALNNAGEDWTREQLVGLVPYVLLRMSGHRLSKTFEAMYGDLIGKKRAGVSWKVSNLADIIEVGLKEDRKILDDAEKTLNKTNSRGSALDVAVIKELWDKIERHFARSAKMKEAVWELRIVSHGLRNDLIEEQSFHHSESAAQRRLEKFVADNWNDKFAVPSMPNHAVYEFFDTDTGPNIRPFWQKKKRKWMWEIVRHAVSQQGETDGR
jgi:hypothetical protein